MCSPDGEAHVEQSANIVTQEIDNRDSENRYQKSEIEHFMST